MDCQLFERQVQRSIDGLLAAHEQQDMLKHAASCPDCAALLQDLRELDGLLHTQLGAVEVPQGFADAVMAALPAPYTKPARLLAFPRQRWLRFGSVAAAAVLLISAGVYGLLPSSPGTNQTLGPINIAQLVKPEPDLNPQQQISDYAPQPARPNPNHGEDLTGLENPDATDDPQDPVQENPTATEQPRETQPKEEPLPPVVIPVGLPMPAINPPQTGGVLSPVLLVAYEDCDAILPSLNGEGMVEYYIKYKGVYHLWTQTLDAEAAPEYVGQVKNPPSLSAIAGSADGSAVTGYTYVSAVSPDGRLLAVNCGGEQPGLWLYDNLAVSDAASVGERDAQGVEVAGAQEGGKILSWSPDGNKLLYSDASGKLFVYYLAEELPVSLNNGVVSCASWAGDSNTVIFAGKEDKAERSGIYAIQVP